jgi:hypothetical protein
MRDLTQPQKDALAAKVKRIGLLVEIAYPTPVLAWSGRGDVVWGTKTFHGVGAFGGITAVEEKVGARAGQVLLTLNGVPSDRIADALDNASAGREVQIWVALFNLVAGVWSIVASPNRIIWGDTDVHEVIEDDRTCTIQVAVETPLARLTVLSVLRYCLADHQRVFPGDRFFEYAPQVANNTMWWPTPDSQAVASGSSASGGTTVLR